MTAAKVKANLGAATGDLARVVEYRPGGAMLGMLPWALILVAVAMAMLVFDSSGGDAFLPAVALLVLLPGFLVLDLWKLRPSAPPDLVLSPQGLTLTTAGWGVLRAPWPAIQAIDSRSFEGFALRYRGRQKITFHDVTMIRLPRGFLDGEREAGRFAPEGPTVNWVVRPDADGDWIALHHETFSLTPAELRGPVEARWRAFRRGEAPAPAPSPPLRLGGFRPKRPSLFKVGTGAGLIAILVVLANMAGLWETQAQANARAWADKLEAMREEDRAWRREQDARDERFRQMFDRPGFPFDR